MHIDSHQHFWSYSAEEYPWIDAAKRPLMRDFLPSDLQPLLRQTGLNGSVAVQARQSLTESRWLLELAEQNPAIVGVVGWVDLRSPRVEEQLAEFAPHEKFVGVRHVVQDEPDDRFLLLPEFVRGLRLLPRFGLTYDLLIYPRQLPAAIELVRLLPNQPFVLDHIAKPPIASGEIGPWRSQIRELAHSPNVLCKISGMVTEADWSGWQPADFRPYLETVLEAFGPGRLMFGSDWPVCLLAGEYDRVFSLVNDFITSLTADERRGILGANAAKFYGLSSPNS